MTYTRKFQELGRGDAGVAGGKGASLGEMTKAGIPVPPGFVITADTFEFFLRESGLHEQIDAVLHEVNTHDVGSVERASEEIHALILSAEIPEKLITEIRSAFTELDARYVAVRSSATAEDGATAAWAGQLESFLNTEESGLLDNVRRCWASLFTPRAIVYRFEKNLHEHHISVAVVVQKMVASEVSGIAFSVHPVTENYNQIIIEAGLGLGEAIVSGQITPDSYIVEKASCAITETYVAEQERGIFRAAGGGNEWRAVDGTKQKLSTNEILELAEIVVGIEKHYGFPCDIEWAYEGGKFYIVQSRPITTLSSTAEYKQVLKKEDFYLTFFAHGVNVLVTDFTRDMYIELKPLVMLKDGLYKQYFRNDYIEYAHELGVTFYSDEDSFENYQNDLRKCCSDFKSFFEEKISGKTKLSKEDVVEFFEHSVLLCKLYCKMDFEYTDKAFTLKDTNPAIARTLAKLASFKDEIRAFMNTAFFEEKGYIPTVFGILSAQFSLPLAVLNLLTRTDFIELFNGRIPDEKTIAERTVAFVINETDPVRQYFQGEDAKKITEIFEDRNITGDEVTGVCASKGKVVGVVKIIPVDYSDFAKVNREIDKMQQGSILIAQTTAPELMAACKKAAAIVTDQGGLMSHAAIVSREFGIPCVVGTKHATKIFKDGDVVEVDANTGVVRKISTTSASEDNERFEYEYQREAPISMFYVWFLGHLRAYELLGLDTMLAEGVYAEYDHGIWKAYTQKNNLVKMKAAVEQLPKEVIEKTIAEYLANFDALQVRPEVSLEKAFIKQLISEFIIVFLVGDMPEHALHAAALHAREKTEKLFYILWESLKKQSPDPDHFDLYTYDEIVKKEIIPAEKLAERVTCKLVGRGIADQSSPDHFYKAYTRDFSLIVQQVWYKANAVGILERLGIAHHPHIPPYVFFMKDGVVEVWENEEAYSWLRDQLVQKINSDHAFVARIEKEYYEKLEIIAGQKEKTISSAQELEAFVEHTYQTISHFLVMYATLLDERVPSEIKKIGERMRETDTVFDDVDKIIRRALAQLYPQVGELTVCILREELGSEISLVEMQKRNEGFAFIPGEFMGVTSFKKFVAQHPQYIFDVDEVETPDQVTGQVAYRGKVTGRVKILKRKSQIHEVAEGDIIVSPMTTPDFVPAMKKAAAFVTEEGGITCHAAIIARELKKPCVIGTRVATEIFKNGDLVEVDADNGIVKKI